MRKFLILTCVLVSTWFTQNAFAQCFMYNGDAQISECQEDYTYTYSADVLFTSSPATGMLILEVDNGTTIYTQAYPVPVADDVPFTLVLNGIPTDGAPSTATVYFSADPACALTFAPYTAPECECTVDIGTFTPSVTGVSTDPYTLCFGDVLTITDNGDQVPPTEATVVNPGDPTYDPTYGWLVYSCPPSVGVTPSTTEDLADDPCLVLQSGGLPAFLFYGDLSELNDLYWEINYPGVFTDNTVYFVPISVYSQQDGFYSFTNTPQGCYEMGAPFAIQYLPEITETHVNDCTVNTVTATINGGSPEVNGTLFTVVAGSLTPATASFVNTTCADGGTIVLSNVTGGQNYSFDVEDDNGCSVTVSGTMNGDGVASISYPQNSYCVNAANASPTITGAQGGTFTSQAGLNISASTGIINISASTPGTYTMNYATAGACPATGSFQLTINGLPAVSAGPDQIVCPGTAVTLNGSGAASYTWTGGITNGIAFSPVSTQTYTVTGTSAAGCQNTDDVTITVNAPIEPQFSSNIYQGCSPLTVTLSSGSVGSNCTWNFGDGSTLNGCGPIQHTFTEVGCYDVSLSMNDENGCSSSSTQANMICVLPDPVASFTANPMEVTVLDPVSQMVNSSTNAASYSWLFSDGSTSFLENPAHEFPSESTGTYLVQLTAISEAGCTDMAQLVIVVKEDLIFYVPNTFTPDGDEFNQTFQPVFATGFDRFNFKLYIFDRWGEIIFESNDAATGWDGTYKGTAVQDGVYTWKIEYKLIDKDDRDVAVGHVNVLK